MLFMSLRYVVCVPLPGVLIPCVVITFYCVCTNPLIVIGVVWYLARRMHVRQPALITTIIHMALVSVNPQDSLFIIRTIYAPCLQKKTRLVDPFSVSYIIHIYMIIHIIHEMTT